MDNKKFKLALAITVLAIPLAVGGCGCSGCSSKDIEDITSGIESIEESEVKDTIEEDLADEGIIVDTPTQESEVTPTPTPEADISTLDTSMAGTFYVIAKDGIPYFAEDDESSEVLGTFEYDTELTSVGMSTETSLFRIELADGSFVWVSSEYLDTVRGGYNPSATPSETPSDTQPEESTQSESDTPSDTPSEGTDSDIEIDEEFKEEIGKTIEDILDAGIPSMNDWLPSDASKEEYHGGNVDGGDSPMGDGSGLPEWMKDVTLD